MSDICGICNKNSLNGECPGHSIEEIYKASKKKLQTEVDRLGAIVLEQNQREVHYVQHLADDAGKIADLMEENAKLKKRLKEAEIVLQSVAEEFGTEMTSSELSDIDQFLAEAD